MDQAPLLLLHGALGGASQFDELRSILKKDFDVHALNFTGHGGTEIPSRTFTIQLFADDIVNYLDQHLIRNANIFGYSMGGYAAMWLARQNPGLTGSIMTLATKWDWSEDTVLRETSLLDPVKMEQKIPAFAKTLEKRHAPQDWKEVVLKTAEMMKDLSKHPLAESDFRTIEIPVRICVGERDTMVSLEESADTCRQLQTGSLEVLPSTPHPFEKTDINLLARSITRFFLQ